MLFSRNNFSNKNTFFVFPRWNECKMHFLLPFSWNYFEFCLWFRVKTSQITLIYKVGWSHSKSFQVSWWKSTSSQSLEIDSSRLESSDSEHYPTPKGKNRQKHYLFSTHLTKLNLIQFNLRILKGSRSSSWVWSSNPTSYYGSWPMLFWAVSKQQIKKFREKPSFNE